MRFMNDYDLGHAHRRFSDGGTPNRYYLVLTVDRLARWANDNSDGWAHWPKPARAANKAMALIESRTSRENDEQEANDATWLELRAALSPIKAFLTREGIPHDEVILPHID